MPSLCRAECGVERVKSTIRQYSWLYTHHTVHTSHCTHITLYTYHTVHTSHCTHITLHTSHYTLITLHVYTSHYTHITVHTSHHTTHHTVHTSHITLYTHHTSHWLFTSSPFHPQLLALFICEFSGVQLCGGRAHVRASHLAQGGGYQLFFMCPLLDHRGGACVLSWVRGVLGRVRGFLTRLEGPIRVQGSVFVLLLKISTCTHIYMLCVHHKSCMALSDDIIQSTHG